MGAGVGGRQGADELAPWPARGEEGLGGGEGSGEDSGVGERPRRERTVFGRRRRHRYVPVGVESCGDYGSEAVGMVMGSWRREKWKSGERRESKVKKIH